MAYPQYPHATFDEFKNAVDGQFVDIDGLYGAQCWDGACLIYVQNDINQYLYTGINFGGLGYAKECWTYQQARLLNGGGHFSLVYDKEDIKKGDIIVFDTLQGWYGTAGHIGYACEDYNGTDTISLLSENFGQGSNPVTGKAFNILNAYLGGGAFLGAFRLDMWNQPTPPPPVVTKKQRDFPWAIAWNRWWKYH